VQQSTTWTRWNGIPINQLRRVPNFAWARKAVRTVNDWSSDMLRLRTVSALVLGMLCAAWPAGAQTTVPTFELSAGYQFTRVPDENLPLGFAIDASRNWGSLGLVAEGGWAHKSDDSQGFDSSLNLWHLGAGPRWSSWRSAAVTPYAQVIAGMANLRASFGSGASEQTDSATKFMVQPGAGISFNRGDGWAVFGAADYRRVFIGEDDGGGENEFRFLIGVRMLLE
jgi:hypothetical protein